MFDAKKLLDALIATQQASGSSAGSQSGGGVQGGMGGLLGSVLGQATSGLKGAAQQSGVGAAAGDAIGRMTGGKTPADLVAKAREMLSQNPGASAAALGGLATLLLGSKAGRGLAVDAAKLGGLALVGGLAYQAWQNFQQGKPPLQIGQAGPAMLEPPAASPFGTTGNAERDNATALLLLRAMIAAASADGIVDEAERAHIVGNVQQLGFDADAARFLQTEFATPATPQALAAAAPNAEVGAQVYAAARLAIDPDEPTERAFLTELGQRLNLDPGLVLQIDAAAEAAKVQRPA
jgi:uncharacterized membrane protein YebE (DUF533 family)